MQQLLALLSLGDIFISSNTQTHIYNSFCPTIPFLDHNLLAVLTMYILFTIVISLLLFS